MTVSLNIIKISKEKEKESHKTTFMEINNKINQKGQTNLDKNKQIMKRQKKDNRK